MLNDNIKLLRKRKGLTQEELAVRVNVVRQTVSKWEKGLSVPDAEMLQKIAEVLDTSVSQLLGATEISEPAGNEVVEQLSRINEQLAIKNRRSRRIWKTLGIIAAVIVIGCILLIILSAVAFHNYQFTNTGPVISAAEEIQMIEP